MRLGSNGAACKNSNSSENNVGAKYEFNKETTWVAVDFSFSDAKDNGKDYSLAGTVGMKLFCLITRILYS